MRELSSPSGIVSGIAIAVGTLYFVLELSTTSGLGFPLDDSWIHLQFAWQVADGQGLAFNTGEPIGGSTSLLWTALIAVGFSVVPKAAILVWTKLLGILFFVLTCRSCSNLCRQLGSSTSTAMLAGSLAATTPWLAWSAISGMEICLFSWLSLLGLRFHIRELERPTIPAKSLFVFGLATLARPEGLILIAIAVASRWRARRLAMSDLAIAAIAAAPFFFIYWTLNGEPVPTTFSSKGASLERLLPSQRFLKLALGILFESQPITVLLAGGGALAMLARAKRGSGLVACWPVALIGAYSLLAPHSGNGLVGNFGRYLFPLIPPIVVLGVLALDAAAFRPRLRQALMVAILIPQLLASFRGPSRYLQTRANVDQSVVAAATWLLPRIDTRAIVAAQDIGALKYHLPNEVLDLTGITNPEIVGVLADVGGEGSYWETRLLAYLSQRRPDFLVVYPRSYPQLVAAPGFERLQTFEIDHNVTMAGSQLMLFSTPWNRFPLPLESSSTQETDMLKNPALSPCGASIVADSHGSIRRRLWIDFGCRLRSWPVGNDPVEAT